MKIKNQISVETTPWIKSKQKMRHWRMFLYEDKDQNLRNSILLDVSFRKSMREIQWYEDKSYEKLNKIGSCSLRIIHNAPFLKDK